MEEKKEGRKEVGNRIANRRRRKHTFLGQCIVSSAPLSAFRYDDDNGEEEDDDDDDDGDSGEGKVHSHGGERTDRPTDLRESVSPSVRLPGPDQSGARHSVRKVAW